MTLRTQLSTTLVATLFAVSGCAVIRSARHLGGVKRVKNEIAVRP